MVRAAVTGSNLRYVAGAAALLRGLQRHHPEVDRYCFVPEGDVAAVRESLRDLAQVLPIPRRLAGLPNIPPVQASFSRFFAPSLPADVVAWFDCDMVLVGPVGGVWDVAPGRVNAVTDDALSYHFILARDRDRQAFARAFPEKCGHRGVNSGLFALRPADWPDLPERLEALVAQCDFDAIGAEFDQLYFNALLLDRVDPLDRRYNFHCVYDRRIDPGCKVVHFTGSLKPWMPKYPRHEPAYYYWLRHGVGERSRWRLALALLRIWARTPRRLLSRLYKNRPRRPVTLPEGTA